MLFGSSLLIRVNVTGWGVPVGELESFAVQTTPAAKQKRSAQELKCGANG